MRRLRRVYLFYHARRVAHGHRLGRNVLCDDACGANDAAAANGDARQDRDVAADPAVVADGDGRASLGSARAIADAIVDGVGGRVKVHVGTGQDPVANRNGASVEPGAVGVDVHILAEPGRETSASQSHGNLPPRCLLGGFT